MNGKGSKQRPIQDKEKFKSNYERIFGSKGNDRGADRADSGKS